MLFRSEMRDKIILENGSVENINEIPSELKEVYKTVWEVSQKTVIDMSADRAPFIDQTQSMNLFVGEPNPNLLTKMHFYTWSNGLKTGMYYLRTRPKASTQQFTIDPRKSKSNLLENTNITQSNEPEECLSCGA